MPEAFKPIGNQVILQFLEFQEQDSVEDGEKEPSGALEPAIIVDAGPDCFGGIKKGATALVDSWAMYAPRLNENLVITDDWCVRAIVSG